MSLKKRNFISFLKFQFSALTVGDNLQVLQLILFISIFILTDLICYIVGIPTNSFAYVYIFFLQLKDGYGSKEEIISLLMRKTELCKKLEIKISGNSFLSISSLSTVNRYRLKRVFCNSYIKRKTMILRSFKML